MLDVMHCVSSCISSFRLADLTGEMIPPQDLVPFMFPLPRVIEGLPSSLAFRRQITHPFAYLLLVIRVRVRFFSGRLRYLFDRLRHIFGCSNIFQDIKRHRGGGSPVLNTKKTLHHGTSSLPKIIIGGSILRKLTYIISLFLE